MEFNKNKDQIKESSIDYNSFTYGAFKYLIFKVLKKDKKIE